MVVDIKTVKMYERNGIYYVKLYLIDQLGNQKEQWISTRVKANPGNKKKAMMVMDEIVGEKRREIELGINGNISALSQQHPIKTERTLADCLTYWLSTVKHSVDLNTYADYYRRAHNKIIPYFGEKKTVRELTAGDIDTFYTYLMDEVGNTANTVHHVHANLSPALGLAVEKGWADINVVKSARLPKKKKFVFSYYKMEELELLLKIVGEKDPFFEFPIIAGAMYGLRRSEIIGLKWSAIDFEANTITINHTVTEFSYNGKVIRQEKSGGKSESSSRSLPLLVEFREILLRIKSEHEFLVNTCGSWYDNKYADYIYLDKQGERVKSSYITSHYALFLKKNHLRKIRFHELRHSCASLLLSRGIPMKIIQEWLGHSSYAVTDKFYAALDVSSLNLASDVMNNCFHLSHKNS